MSVLKVLVTTLCAASLGATAHATPEGDKTRAEVKAAFGFVPGFIKMVPDRALPGAWGEMGGFQMNPNTLLSGKAKELIGLAVAAQVPCRYCIYAHTEFAKLNGATQDEIAEAVTVAALTRHWSTFINGIVPDESEWRASIDKVVAWLTNPPKGPMAPPAVDPKDPAKSALAEIKAAFGSVPDFLAKMPPAALPAAWAEMRDVELDSKTAIDPKTKSLISVAVAAQIPCRFCLIADAAFAKLSGATEPEIAEALTMASIVRHWSTLMNGLQLDEAGFKRDVDRIVRDVRKSAGR